MEVLPLPLSRGDRWRVQAERGQICSLRALGQQWPSPVCAAHWLCVEDPGKSPGWGQ